MKKLALISCVAILFLFVTPVFADSPISSLVPENPNIGQGQGFTYPIQNMIGVCFTISQSATVTRLTVDIGKTDSNAPNPPTFTGTIRAELYTTTGNPGAQSCPANSSVSPFAISSTVAIESLLTVPAYSLQTFTFSGQSMPAGSYIVGVRIIETGGAGFVQTTSSGVDDASKTYEDNYGQGTAGSFNPSSGDTFPCVGTGACMSYTLYGNSNSPPPSNPKPTIIASGFVGAFLVVLIAGVTLGKKSFSEEELHYAVTAVISLGIIFLFLVAAGL